MSRATSVLAVALLPRGVACVPTSRSWQLLRLLRLAGGDLTEDKPLHGRDAWAAIAAGAPSPHEEILLNVTPWSGALRMGRWKLVHDGGVPANAIQGPARDVWELFDLAADPSEQASVADQQIEVHADLRARFDALRSAAAAPNFVSNGAPEGFAVPKVWGEPRLR